MTRCYFSSLLAAVGLCMAMPTDLLAAAGPWQKSDVAEARIVSAVEATGDLKALPLGIEVHIKDHWKTYWRSPGETGLPPTLDWGRSTNVGVATLSYPAPLRFSLFDHQTFGYKERVIFPVTAAVISPGEAVNLHATLDLLVCEKICVPETLELALALPAGPAGLGAEAQDIARFQAQVPVAGPANGLAITGVKAIETGGKTSLEVTATSSGDGFAAADVFVEVEPSIALAAPRLSPKLGDSDHQLTFRLPLEIDLPPGASLAQRKAIVTLVNGGNAIEQTFSIEQGTGPGLTTMLGLNAAMVGVALLGGLILNLMPCVLPVLSLKLMSLVAHSDAPPTHVRVNFLATAAGIVFSLLVIAVVLIGLRSAGLAIGWGIQFQQPAFIAAMAVIVALFACNMLGLFEIILPASWSNFAGSAGADTSVVGNFAIGAFATLLATPCSAPFVGTAVGFALAGGPAQILMIFLALGVGLASPYLAIAARPSVARFIPKPGRWMVRLRQVLGLALAGTTVWLLSILPGQVGTYEALGVAMLIGAMVCALAVPLVRPSAPSWIGSRAAGVFALAALSLPVAFGTASVSARNSGPDLVTWVAFDRDQIRSLVSQGKTVFVDVTADWCVVCKSNKKLVINTQDVSARLRAPVIAMRADWTSPNPKISAFLAGFGRYGIPLNVVYGPGASGGILLPELLTQDSLLAALDTASGRETASQLRREPPKRDGG